MAIHIIDPSKPLPPTYGDYEHALRIDEGDTLIVSEGVSIEAYGYGAAAIWGTVRTTVLIDGTVISQNDRGVATHGTITIGSTGRVSGFEAGVYLMEDRNNEIGNLLQNDGSIQGSLTGVLLYGLKNVIFNSGKIVGSTGIMSFGYPESMSGDTLSITNTGIIKGVDGTAIEGIYHGPNLITNKGHIEGRVILGQENDIYDGRGGTVTGEIFLGAGDDIAYGGSASETFFAWAGDDFVDGGGGVDTLLLSWDGWGGTAVAHTVDLRATAKQYVGTNSWITLRNVENLVGGNVKDVFIGNTEANTLIGNGGNDTLDGYDGNDLLSGGSGNDLLVGGSGSDTTVFTGKFSDYTITVVAGVGITITDNRASGDGTDYLGGVEFALFSDRIYTLPPVGPVTPSTPAEIPVTPTSTSTPHVTPVIKNLTFKGGRKADTFVGGKGHDLLNGGLGKDKLTGDEGQDTFVFDSKLGSKNVDRILDFQHADDTIKLSKSIFSKFEKGMLSKGAFWIGAKAHDKNDRIIYNDKTGALFYDADGTGKKYGAIKFAQLTAKTLLKHDDFFIA
jgi:serralysin